MLDWQPHYALICDCVPGCDARLGYIEDIDYLLSFVRINGWEHNVETGQSLAPKHVKPANWGVLPKSDTASINPRKRVSARR